MSLNGDMVQIHINSSNAVNSNGSSYMFDLPNKIIMPESANIYIELTSMEVDFSFYTVNSNNNVLDFNANSTIYTITFVPGNYDCFQLRDLINTELNLLGLSASVVCSYTDITNKFTFTATNLFNIYGSSTCLDLLGFSSQNHSGFVVTSDLVADVYSYVQKIIVSSSFPTENQTTGGQQSILAAVPINASYLGVISYDGSKYKFRTYVDHIDVFTITIQDQSGQAIDLNGHLWTATLTFYIKQLYY